MILSVITWVLVALSIQVQNLILSGSLRTPTQKNHFIAGLLWVKGMEKTSNRMKYLKFHRTLLSM